MSMKPLRLPPAIGPCPVCRSLAIVAWSWVTSLHYRVSFMCHGSRDDRFIVPEELSDMRDNPIRPFDRRPGSVGVING